MTYKTTMIFLIKYMYIIYASLVHYKNLMQLASDRFCSPNSLDAKLVKGKIVLCEGSQDTDEALKVGAIGALTQGQGFRDVADYFPLVESYLQPKDASNIHKYIHYARTLMATIFKSHELENALAPVVASFSS